MRLPPLTRTTHSLAGTAPSHRAHIFLHSPVPPAHFPARHATPIQRALQLKTLPWGASVNFVWLPHLSSHEGATAFSQSGRLDIPSITLKNIDAVDSALHAHAHTAPVSSPDDEVHLYVCTHGARDCRCGDIGTRVVSALRAEIALRAPTDPRARRVRVGEVAHVGGHQYAANMLVFPHGDWLGLLQPADIPGVLDAILAAPVRPRDAHDVPLVRQHWRGRMGMPKEAQREMYVAGSTNGQSV
ncbi:Sucrase/ferredoxin-like-domain-containing protein [Infundibulicybe gibba]|nr:Sucrase/ferredoxin-like-domain-containing protein [Infundibulicybe gibba]